MRKDRKFVPPKKWSEAKYTKALEQVYDAAEALLSPPGRYDQISTVKLLIKLQDACDKVPYTEKEVAK